ncbi:hypothetical protein B296_00029338 [Ensete ventricosum]|uniref:Uncharacterized protein n=1 Tax=Ensete ventricosum TaxID=4639 RepID=A0A426ZW12_ENSVE|nr:hypothetical protein B296_00029338 [Ensete ventricosum]
MTSSPSLTISGFTSSSSSSVPPPRVESCHPSGPAGDRSEPSSSSSGILTRSDIKAIRAMEIMKSHHDFDSTLSVESLVLIRKRFSILDEYALHAPLPEQRSYHELPGGIASRGCPRSAARASTPTAVVQSSPEVQKVRAEMTTLSLLSVGRSMMALYADGSLTIMNDTINIFYLGSSFTVTGRVIVPRGEMESPVNLVNVDVI